MKVRELTKKNRGRVSWAHSTSHTSHFTKCTHLLLNEYCRRSPRWSPLSAAASPLLAAERRWAHKIQPPSYTRSRFTPFPYCLLVIGSCCSEVIFTLSGAQRRAAGMQRRSAAISGESGDNTRVRYLSRCSALCVMQAGAKFTHILELTFKQQIFMIFIVDYFCKKEFLKIEKILIRGQSF